uniref:RNA-directed RNA polymerase n=1 Tax=Steinernema glaseri TaxID=37863 RepID=A0A1I8A8V0_9BILA
MERISHPTYISSSLNGQLYRRSRHIDLIISQAQDLQVTSPLTADPDMVYEGYKSYIAKAMRDSNCYNSNLSALLENYGIADEAQAFTGMISKCRNRISDRDNDDMSFFNTNYVIEQRLNEIFRNAREQFFVEFGGYEHCTVDDASYRSGRKLQKTTDDNDTNRRYCNRKHQKTTDENDMNRRYCKYPTDAMKKKASAYYWVCYAIASRTESRFLSFAWVCWDILSEIKKEAYMRKEFKIQGVPLHTKLHEYIIDYSESDEVGEEFLKYKKELREYQGFAAPYARAFEGTLSKECEDYMYPKWANMHNLLSYEFSHECLNALLILHGIDAFRTSDSVVSSVWLGEIPNDNKKLSLLDRVGFRGSICRSLRRLG